MSGRHSKNQPRHSRHKTSPAIIHGVDGDAVFEIEICGEEAEKLLEAEILAEEKEELELQEEGATETHVPWYLQEQPQEAAEPSPMAHRQRLPDLPEYPPELLQPLLQHVSVELGLDDLTLLDLRQLDPPPALGSNLLIGAP